MATIDVAPVIADINTRLSAAPLKYPIANDAALISTPTGATVTVSGRTVQLDSVLPQLAATDYPITSVADMQQKVSVLVTKRTAAASSGLSKLTAQLPQFTYPIANVAQLVKQASSKTYTLDGKAVNFQKAATSIPATDFPITSATDFDTKMSSLAVTLALTTSGPSVVL